MKRSGLVGWLVGWLVSFNNCFKRTFFALKTMCVQDEFEKINLFFVFFYFNVDDDRTFSSLYFFNMCRFKFEYIDFLY